MLAAFAAATFAAIVTYALWASDRQAALRGQAAAGSAGGIHVAELLQHPHLLFRDTAPGPGRGQLAVVSLEDPKGARATVPLRAERVHAGPAGGIALAAAANGTATYDAVVLDENLQPRTSVRLAGVPNRARVSRDGRLAAVTGFVAGDSYDPGGFSTRTAFVDLAAGTYVANLEDFTLWRDGVVARESDLNFWGVTFAIEPNRFFASVATGGIASLIEGNVATHEATVRRSGVECPSLSPDGTRLAFKSRRPGSGDVRWGLHVMDLRSGVEVEVAETRNVDDQAEWLDDSTILYALARTDGPAGASDVWSARADGTGRPELFVENAASPCVRRP